MSCDPERVSGFVDGELDAESAAELGAHLATCAACRTQAEEERSLRERLRALPAPALPPGLETRLRARLLRTSPIPTLARWALPLAATLVAGFWVRGYAPFVAWELARDHDHCFSFRPLPAEVRSGEPAVVAAWFERRGTRLPRVPARVDELALVGARFCSLFDSSHAPHVYYASAAGGVSVFVVPHGVRLERRFAGPARGRAVRLLRLGPDVIGIVGERDREVRAFEAALRPTVVAEEVVALLRLPLRGSDRPRGSPRFNRDTDSRPASSRRTPPSGPRTGRSPGA